MTYISGKITGNPDYKKNFAAAEKQLIASGCRESEIFNPARVTLPLSATWKDYMRHDLKILLECNEVYMLRDWQDSEGARLEHFIAKKLGYQVTYQE